MKNIILFLILLFFIIKFCNIHNLKETFISNENNKNNENNLNSKIRKMYYINLDRHKDRRIYMEKQFKNNNLNIERYRAFDKNLIDNDYLNNMKNNGILERNYTPHKDKYGSVACLISHTNLYKYIKKNFNYGIFLIFEDDCKILGNFSYKLNLYLSTLPKDWDMCWLGYNKIKGKKFNKYWYKPKKGPLWGYNSQHHCYLINYNGIDKILNILLPIYKNFNTKDTILRLNFDKFNAYFLKEKLAIQDMYEFPISERTGLKNG